MNNITRILLSLVLTISFVFFGGFPANAITISPTIDDQGNARLLLAPDPVIGNDNLVPETEASPIGVEPSENASAPCSDGSFSIQNNDFLITRHTPCDSSSRETLIVVGDGGNEDTAWSFDFDIEGISLPDGAEQIQSAFLTLKNVNSKNEVRTTFSEKDSNENLFIVPLKDDDFSQQDDDFSPVTKERDYFECEETLDSCYAVGVVFTPDENNSTLDALQFDLLKPYSASYLFKRMKLGSIPFVYYDDSLIQAAKLEIVIDGEVELLPNS